MIKKLRIQPPKSLGGQPRFKGIAMSKAEAALFFKVNEIIEYIRRKK